MVKFEQKLEHNLIPEWREKYIRYGNLKVGEKISMNSVSVQC